MGTQSEMAEAPGVHEQASLRERGTAGHSAMSANLLDACVVCHSATAFLFASTMIIYPDAFSLFSVEPMPALALDSIRWASPFVFGFSWLAAISLQMPPRERIRVAWMYTAAFTLATGVGVSVQASGRWNPAHVMNVLLFAGLAVMYATFLVFHPGAFYRPSHGRGHALFGTATK